MQRMQGRDERHRQRMPKVRMAKKKQIQMDDYYNDTGNSRFDRNME